MRSPGSVGHGTRKTEEEFRMLAMRASLWFRCLFLAGNATGIVAALQLASSADGSAATSVRCATANLQTAIDGAVPGSTLSVSGTCPGNFTIDKDLTLVGQGTAVLDGRRGGSTLTVSSGATVRAGGLTITDGNATDGGGIDNAGSLTLTDSTVDNNSGGSGGGIYNTGSLTLKDVTVSGNSGSVDGGGIYSNGGMTLQGATVTGNSTVYSGGGIFSCCGYSPVTLKDSTIAGNSAGAGGGLFNLLDYATLIDTKVSGNTATLDAGGIDNNAGGTTLIDSTVTGNTAGMGGGSYYGGGVYTFSGTVTVIKGSTVTRNSPYNCAPLGAVDGCAG
jgi:predicted outer membrane repeat protein